MSHESGMIVSMNTQPKEMGCTSTQRAQIQPLLHSKRDVAELLSVSPRTIDNLILRKELAVRRIGRRVMITVKELERFLRHDHPTALESA